MSDPALHLPAMNWRGPVENTDVELAGMSAAGLCV
jgi:hypothetical protein